MARQRTGWRASPLRRTPVLAALFVLLATGALAGARYATTPPVYVAAQTLAIVVTPPDSSTSLSSYDQALSAQQAIQVAQLITTPTFLTSSAFESDVAMRLQGLPGDATTRAVTTTQIGQALTAQAGGANGQGDVSGALVTLAARWATATGAPAVLMAATAALQFDATQLVQVVVAAAGASATPTAASGATPTTSASNAPVTPPLAASDLIGAQAVGAATAATRDGGVAGAARTRLYEQLALALIVALLLGAALQWALTRRR